MKALVIGDLHISLRTYSTVNIVLQEIYKTIKNHMPDLIILLGDNFDNGSKIDVACYNLFVDFIHSIAEWNTIMILVGNHDFSSNEGFGQHFFRPFREYFNVYVVDNMYQHPNNEDLVFLPFYTSEKFPIIPDNKLVFCHQEFYGMPFCNGITSTTGVIPNPKSNFISGHYHAHVQLNDNVLYTGTPYQINFGETDQKYIFLLEIDGWNYKIIQKIQLQGVPKSITVNKISDIKKCNVGYDNVRLKLEFNNTAEYLAFKKSKEFQNIPKEVKVSISCKDIKTTNLKVVRTSTNYLEILHNLMNEKEQAYFYSILQERGV